MNCVREGGRGGCQGHLSNDQCPALSSDITKHIWVVSIAGARHLGAKPVCISENAIELSVL